MLSFGSMYGLYQHVKEITTSVSNAKLRQRVGIDVAPESRVSVVGVNLAGSITCTQVRRSQEFGIMRWQPQKPLGAGMAG